MDRTTITDAPNRPSTASVCRSIADALGITGFECNYFEVAPGETFSPCLHSVEGEEEICFVLEGEATFETEETQVSVGPGEVVRFDPMEFQHGLNEGSKSVVALVLAAPKDTPTGSLICPECGERDQADISYAVDGDVRIVSCRACGVDIARQD